MKYLKYTLVSSRIILYHLFERIKRAASYPRLMVNMGFRM